MADSCCDAFVFFGASGDLAYKQIFPALQALVRRGKLDMPVIGVANTTWTVEQFRARAKESMEKHGGLDPAAYDRLCPKLDYIAGEYQDPNTFQRLRQALGNAKRPLYYLAIPPALFEAVIEGLGATGCGEAGRVIVEKPFGRDQESAQELNDLVRRCFPDDAVFRIDHYLGKEPVQNLLYFRFANPLFEAGWNNKHLESVQITMAENFGVAGRGRFYDEVGAIRDVVQNHMLQLIACIAMEQPASRDHLALREQRARLLRKIRALEPSDVVRGRYRGYRKEPGVAPDSTTETFAALRFSIDNRRWSGVPFYVRAGKALATTATEIFIWFQRPPRPVLDENTQPLANYYRFRLSPEVVLALGTKVKRPGEYMVGERLELVARDEPPGEMQPYERLLGDALKGDPSLFAGQDAVEESWRIVDKILGDATPLFEYEPGSWGPSEVDELIMPAGGWHNPRPTEESK